MDFLSGIIGAANGVLWGAPMLLLMLISGGYFSVRTGFFQLRRGVHCLKRTVLSRGNRQSSEGAVSPFQAMSSALAATLGTGNIAGVAAALAAGGAGAVFWMWLSAVLGMMTGYAENVLGAYYRRKKPDGSWQGGAMYYIRDGLAEKSFTKRLAKPLAAVFAAACVLSAFGMGNIVQMNSAAAAMKAGFGLPTAVTGVLLTLAAAAVFFLGKNKSGVQRIAAVTEKLVPVMSVFYIAAAVYILAANFTRLPSVLGVIIQGAFGLKAAAGGVSGYMVKQAVSMGFRRGVFSNEAGLGSSVAAHAASDTAEPCVVGMWSIFEVFFDTIVMCSMTAFVLLASPCREAPMQEVFRSVTTQPQYFRLAEQDGLITSGTAMIKTGSGREYRLRTAGGGEFTVRLSTGDITCSNVMKLTGVQSRSKDGLPLYLENGSPAIESVILEEVSGAELMTLAFSGVFGSAAGKLLSAALTVFAFTTVIGWCGFGAQAAEYLFGSRSVLPFRIVYTLLAAVGGMLDMSAAWGIADLFNGVMAAVNLPAVLILSGTVLRLTRDYCKRTFGGKVDNPQEMKYNIIREKKPAP